MTGEQATEGPERPLPALASSEERGIEASPSSFLPEAAAGDSKPAKAPIGSDRKTSQSAHRLGDAFGPADPPQASPGPAGPDGISAGSISLEKECGRSACEPYRQVILEKLEQGLSAQRIYQDLRGDGFDHEYHSVRRFVARLQGTSPLPFRRMECDAGEEAQVDFGTGAWIELPDGKRRRSHVFRIVLSYSRKGYSEAVYRQTTEDFIRCIENAFWHFGGVPKVLVIDNLKAAVKQPDWYDPELNPKIQSFCEHYGCVILPTKPRTPQAQGEDRKRRQLCPREWLEGPRLHEPGERERTSPRLGNDGGRHPHSRHDPQAGRQALPGSGAAGACSRCRWSGSRSSMKGKRIVHRDGHVEVAKAYYSVPPEYLGHTLWVRWDLRLVRIFNNRMEQIAVHVRKEPGQLQHAAGTHPTARSAAASSVGRSYLLSRARCVGEHTRPLGRSHASKPGESRACGSCKGCWP